MEVLIFVMFMVIALIVITTVWNSFVYKLKKEIWKSKGMLRMIPNDFLI